MRLLLAVTLVALSVLPTRASQNESKAVGEFCGTYFNGTKYQDITTKFQLASGGRLSGTYEFEDDGRWESGTLDPAPLESDGSVKFVWHDKYGSGVLTLQFHDDFSSFSGAWSKYQGPVLDWTGKRKCPDKGSV
jgi:hypothetical protein